MKNLKKLINTLKKRKLTIATAESCSGGYLSYILTKIPGSSNVFKGGIIAYSLEAKTKFFKISPTLLKRTQGVSEEISIILARKVRKLFNADIGASIVGFAGPKAKKGTKAGTVFIGVADKKGTTVKKTIIKGPRDQVRKKSSELAIKILYDKIMLKSQLLCGVKSCENIIYNLSRK